MPAPRRPGGGTQPYLNAGVTELADMSGPTPAESNLSGLGCNLGLWSFSSTPGDSNARPGLRTSVSVSEKGIGREL